MAIIDVDGHPYEMDEKENLLHGCLSVGLDLPYFCWHPALGSIGACRQCAVVQYRDEKDTTGRVVMACMTPAANKARISVAAPAARQFRASVVEWLMLNHPHDCPVCEEGGDCHLQDMTVMAGHTMRRYRGRKRTFQNQYLGPFLNHEMNRCITCYRCVRFYRDWPARRPRALVHATACISAAPPECLENAFTGNLSSLPTSVLPTNRPARRTRANGSAIRAVYLPGCAVGCNTFPAERLGRCGGAMVPDVAVIFSVIGRFGGYQQNLHAKTPG
jgi:NADH-quinone oxidoreductase subunit G